MQATALLAIYDLFNAVEEVLNTGPGCDGVCPPDCRHLEAFRTMSRALEKAATVAP